MTLIQIFFSSLLFSLRPTIDFVHFFSVAFCIHFGKVFFFLIKNVLINFVLILSLFSLNIIFFCLFSDRSHSPQSLVLSNLSHSVCCGVVCKNADRILFFFSFLFSFIFMSIATSISRKKWAPIEIVTSAQAKSCF